MCTRGEGRALSGLLTIMAVAPVGMTEQNTVRKGTGRSVLSFRGLPWHTGPCHFHTALYQPVVGTLHGWSRMSTD